MALLAEKSKIKYNIRTILTKILYAYDLFVTCHQYMRQLLKMCKARHIVKSTCVPSFNIDKYYDILDIVYEMLSCQLSQSTYMHVVVRTLSR